MKIVLVNCFDTYENRIDLIHDYFVKKGHNVTVIQSDFRHFKKTQRFDIKQNFIFIKSKPYYKNISIARLISHYNYAKNAFKVVEEIKPDLLYVSAPPNSLAKLAGNYKKNNRKVKLIIDLIDLWPETMPVDKVKRLPPFQFWRLMRDNSLKFADYIITECDLYQSILDYALDGLKTKTVYLAKKNIEVVRKPLLCEEEIHLCYLGSINNVIDIPIIKTIMKSVNEIKPTTLHIIGDGENRELMISEVKNTGSKVAYHGEIYDPQKKQDIFDKCHFGLNIMKKSVCVGLTMKSIDYFQHGLPILNNIQADTEDIVKRYNVGINLKDGNLEELVDKIEVLKEEEYQNMRVKSSEIFDQLFSLHAFYGKLDEITNEVIL
ncbi:glycosyltransferase [Alkalicoccus urumqiensis]|uniref:Glycosyltransferase WbuB n=1 Tax=Alkalicoccus urumqiensis TaxID=1548213 RepID=A0A2P6MHR2_ALKUR|nr:glycosyltransferase [Alkalicoccus urumqiensis]PRO65835.1 hypothetical protein C6I21_08025 [Alkalicoccus urumqiensis]